MDKYDFKLDLSNQNDSSSQIAELIMPHSKVLEFGPAHGRLTRHLKENLECIVDIVEIEEKAGKNAALYANKALLGPVEGNIENYFWYDKFESADYDYIIFADVLEHLFKPNEVILKCQKLIKAEGSILISIPNIAHNCIITNLYYDSFNYTNTGLLDNTHVHFWGLRNLAEFAADCDLIITKLRTVNLFSEGTEQAVFFYPDYKGFLRLLKNRKNGNVYQFIVELKNRDQGKSVNIDSYLGFFAPMRIYVNTGFGYNEEECITDFIQLNEIQSKRYQFDSHEDIVGIRFDPVEELYCKVTILSVKSNVENVKLKALNATLRDSSTSDIFLTPDPCYEVITDFMNLEYLEVEFLVHPINYFDLAENFIEEKSMILQKLESSKNQNEWIEKQIKLVQMKFEQVQSKLKEKQQQYGLLQGQLEWTQEQLRQTLDQWEHTKGQIEQRRLHIGSLENHIREMQNSLSWRITKPLRFIKKHLRIFLS